ncbi:aminotransferase class V-fold PLP-dependent enzyme [Rhizobium ruizarguesonis]|uniref:aminotransferase class V-fold PLP-dependent enzyme n=1 Tax=Rhizobium ruizarguesonis TaxID=2081791 RepID=UPI001031C29E|nr:aminotransferase class V-fold PLP-dependent enzyme [Rhizobium ruizarguesonis]TAT70034.1 aminotransferase class V-fold PLP-dependent enzyme [Rhizobium ruizarguesonis]
MRNICGDFPLLHRTIDDNPIVYLDSAATALKPTAVIEAEANYSRVLGANIHRGVSGLSSETTMHFERARRRVAGFINADPDLVVFTPNTTYALGMIASGIPKEHDARVLVSSNSHHSNLLPWMDRFDVRYVGDDPLSPLTVEEACDAMKRERPAILAINWVSNVNGSISPVAAICAAARELGVVTVVDAAQAIPHLKVDVELLQCDYLAFSGHKMLGPTGTGILWGRRQHLDHLTPLVLGGGTIASVDINGYELKSLPHRLEPGTPNIGGVLGLEAAVEYLAGIDENWLAAHQVSLSQEIANAFSGMQGIEILGNFNGSTHLPIVSLVSAIEGVTADTLCRTISDSSSVMTRSGLHCAHPIFRHYGQMGGALRISAYLYNTASDIHCAAEALERAVHPFLRT